MTVVGHQISDQCKRRGSSQLEEADHCDNELPINGDTRAKLDVQVLRILQKRFLLSVGDWVTGV